MQQKIIIIGASSGIGKELAMLYIRKNFLVGITGRRRELLEEIKKESPETVFVSCFDVMNNEGSAHLSTLIQQMGGMDIFVYNAGYGEVSATLDYEIEHATVQTNVHGFVLLADHAFTYFLNKGHGQIALTSSIAALRGNSLAPAYSASKAFMSNYAEGLSIKARKLRTDIRITDIKPGFVRTKMAKGTGQFWVASPEKAAHQIAKAIEKGKRVAYISKRWWLIAQILKLLPYSIYRKLA